VLAFALAAPTAADTVAPLVSVEWLKAHLAEANVVVLDIRSAIDGGSANAYAEDHIPGAVAASLSMGQTLVVKFIRLSPSQVQISRGFSRRSRGTKRQIPSTRAFPGEVGTGLPSGNATKQRDRALA
jgi:rhodanese-related sulfurtransferase